MMMERYEAYKDSGVEWIGEIPECWFLKRIKSLIRDLRVGPFGSAIKTDDYCDEGVPLYTQETVFRGNWTISKYISNEKSSELQSFDASPGDYLITTRGTLGHVYELPYTSRKGIIHPCLMRFRIDDGCVDGRFFTYTINDSSELIEQVLLASSSSTIPVLYSETLRNAYIAVPPIHHQQAIADYLDAKTAEIDGLVADCEREVELLREYRKAVISEAVTKGLNLDAPMKDSGIEWIGDIPRLWDFVRLKAICRIETGDSDTQDSDPAGEFPFYVRSPIVEHSNSFSFDGEGILMAGDGAGAGRVFHHAFGKYAVHQRVYRMSSIKQINSRLLFYYLSSQFPIVMDQGSAQSTVPSVRKPMLDNLRVCIPIQGEQTEIVDYLDTKTAEIDALIEAKQSMADKLREYRRSLISEAVTGKFKVSLKKDACTNQSSPEKFA